MIPLLASGAASLANVLVNRISGASSTSSGNLNLDPKAFAQALDKASGAKGTLSPLEQQALALNQKFLNSAEMQASIASQPSGSVGGVEIRQDGSVTLQTVQGPVAVPLSLEGRDLARQAYGASVLTNSSSSVSLSGGVQPVLRLPVQNAQLGSFLG